MLLVTPHTEHFAGDECYDLPGPEVKCLSALVRVNSEILMSKYNRRRNSILRSFFTECLYYFLEIDLSYDIVILNITYIPNFFFTL